MHVLIVGWGILTLTPTKIGNNFITGCLKNDDIKLKMIIVEGD